MNCNIEKLRQTYNELLEFKMVLQKASGFLVSSKSHAVAEGRELDDHVYSNDDYADTASLLEQVSKHRTGARSVELSSCFVKPTIVPHFEVPNPFKPRLFLGVPESPFLSLFCTD